MISMTITDPSPLDAKILRAIADAVSPPGVSVHVTNPIVSGNLTAAQVDDIKKAVGTPMRGTIISGTLAPPSEVKTLVYYTNGTVGVFTNPAALEKALADNVGKVMRTVAVDSTGRESAPTLYAHTLADTALSVPRGQHGLTAASVTPIAPEDNPAAGATVLTTEKLNIGELVDAAAVFGAMAAGADPAAVFSGGAPAIPGGAPALPNVLAPTPTPPPLPLPNSQTSTLPSDAATSASPPPPPPPAPAPANASAGATSTSGVQTDKTGMPWDARIHASTKATIQDGTWKKRRGVDAEEVATVEAQLRAAMAVPGPTPARLSPAAAWPFPSANPHADTGEPRAPTFTDLMQFITPRVSTGALTQVQVTAAVQTTGLESLNLVMARVDLIPAILSELQKVAP